MLFSICFVSELSFGHTMFILFCIFSCFIFENFIKQIKKALRKHEKPLQQLVKWYSEGFFNMEIKLNENFTS